MKSGRRPADKPDANCSSTGRVVPPSVYDGFRLNDRAATGGVGGAAIYRGSLFARKQRMVPPPARPSPPALSPNPTPHLLAPRDSGFGLNGSWGFAV